MVGVWETRAVNYQQKGSFRVDRLLTAAYIPSMAAKPGELKTWPSDFIKALLIAQLLIRLFMISGIACRVLYLIFSLQTLTQFASPQICRIAQL
jgi:hypothetical protein